MSSNYEIQQIAIALAAEHKTPTVALIKARLTSSIPLAAIIKGLQYWHRNPEPLKEPAPNKNAQKSKAALGSAQVQQAIKMAITPLLVEIEMLKKRIEKLEESK